MDMSIEAFTFNVERYPKSYNVYHSLGEAYMKKGEKDLAIQNFKKSLEINPWNGWAIKILKEIDTKKEDNNL